MHYRPEIDGLRALAIMPVLFFHAGFDFASGGFIGVDVFFVVSGYLITSILLRDLESDRFSITSFYDRRIRRLFPALATVIIATIPLALLSMSPTELIAFSKSLASTALFVSNFFFYSQKGYFSPEAEEMPLLHTWSLAVEEQFYILFPIALFFAFRYAKKHMGLFIALTALGSFCLAQFGGNLSPRWPFVDTPFYWLNQPEIATFYMPFGRAWELMAGAIIAAVSLDRRHVGIDVAQIGSIVGVLLIVLAAVVYNNHTPFPSAFTLIPVVGTALVIIFTRDGTWAARTLSKRYLVGVGLISYSLYLWHQPLLAFARLQHIGPLSNTSKILILLACFPISYLTWRFIENPARRSGALTPKRVVVAGVAFSTVVALSGLTLVGLGGLPGRFDADYLALSEQAARSQLRGQCHISVGFGRRPGYFLENMDRTCRIHDGAPVIALIGDSHTAELSHALGDRLVSQGEAVLHLGFDNCPPAINYESRRPECDDWTRKVISYLGDHSKIDHVMLVYRHAYHLYGESAETFPVIPDEAPVVYATGSVEERRELYWNDFDELVDALLAANKTIDIVLPIPELPDSIHKMIRIEREYDRMTGTRREYYDARQAEVRRRLLAYSDNVRIIDPAEYMCDENHCFAILDSVPMYFDSDHLSVVGAQYLLDKINLTLPIRRNTDLENPNDDNPGSKLLQ